MELIVPFKMEYVTKEFYLFLNIKAFNNERYVKWFIF